MKRGDVIYYKDELNDDFADNGITAVKIEKDFPFAPKGLLWRIGEFFAYYVFAIPTVALIWLVSGFTIKGRRNIRALAKEQKKRGGKGFFLYANHTHWLDAFAGPLVCFPKKSHVLVSPDTVSIKGVRTFVQMLGAIPVPTERDAVPPFVSAIERRIDQGRAVMIFPEAHIWPFCNFIRDFKPGSFRYPVKQEVPAVGVCVCYKKRRGLGKLRKTPRREVYISEPFWPDASLPAPAAKQKLRDDVFLWLKKTAGENSDVEYVSYIKAEE
ncbi:MAG: 1-acyl-sn-glycerol-3-phosphate acyltransferase [Clostridiales bacterium]|nr:1-acyl-sn-glycerol-3-phosphate acyltransferase [Clostridiales bacterium]